MRITKALFEGLLRLDGRTAQPSPGWAERWEISPDGKTYLFHLRTNATWSTGEPLTTADVLYSWFRSLSPETAADYAGQLFYIRNAEAYYTGKLKDRAQVGIEAVDSRTLRVTLESPAAFFLDLCCFPVLAIVPRQAIERGGDRWLTRKPLPVSGPYELDTWRLNDKVRLRKNPRYWDAANTRSELVDLLPTPSPNTALNLCEDGLADVVWDKELAPMDLMDVLSTRPELHRSTLLASCFYRFNVTRKPLDDARVRRAFALATDPVRLIRKLGFTGEKPASHLVPDGTAAYTAATGFRFDPAQARKLLAQAGYAEGKGFPQLSYLFFSASSGAGKMPGRIAVELQAMWREVLGVEIELRQIERKIFYNMQSRLEYDISASSWVGDYNDANTFLDLFTSSSGNNWTGWGDQRYDQLMRAANQEVDRLRRAELLRQAEAWLLTEGVPIVPLYFYAGFAWFDDTKIHGLHPNLLDEHPIQDIWKADARGQAGIPQAARSLRAGFQGRPRPES